MARKLKFDRGLFVATLLLVCASIVMVYSASAFVDLKSSGSLDYVIKQGLFAVIGVAVLAVVMRIDYRLYRNDAFVATVLVATVLMLLAVFLGTAKNGAYRWLNVGGLGGQPSELAKVACILFTAMLIERRMHRIDDMRHSLMPVALVVGGIAGLVLVQPDFGTAMALLLTAGAMVFVAGLDYRYVIGVSAAAVPLAYLALTLEDYRIQRLMAFWDPWKDPEKFGYHAVQSMIAIGTGGVFGKGLTEGAQKITFLPEPHTDFIFSVISEELGLIGATGFLICFCYIAWRGIRIALRSQDAFATLLAVGFTTMICAQALVNMSVTLSLLPTKGIPLPLVSAGGSSLIVSLLGIGVLLNISQHEAAEA